MAGRLNLKEIYNDESGSLGTKVRVLDAGGERHNVCAFGAIGDGVADDTAAIQALVDGIAEGDILSLPPRGRFRVSRLVITKGICIDAIGAEIVSDTEITAPIIEVAETASSFEMHGGTVRYEGTFFTASSVYHSGAIGPARSGIVIRSEKASLHGVSVRRCSHTGIRAEATCRSLHLIACHSSANGYAGVLSQAANTVVLGGNYNDNGGANGVDGYGVVGNVGDAGDFKCIAATANRNMTRGIDSHTARELILKGNYCQNNGDPTSPIWGVHSTGRNQIQLVRRIDSAVISNNICIGGIHGIVVSGSADYASFSVTDVSMVGNILTGQEGYGIFFRPWRTDCCVVSKNIIKGDPNQMGINVSPIDDTDALSYVRALIVTGNTCNNRILLAGLRGTDGRDAAVTCSNNESIRLEIRAAASALTSIVVSTTGNTINGESLIVIGNANKKADGEVLGNSVLAHLWNSVAAPPVNLTHWAGEFSHNLIRDAWQQAFTITADNAGSYTNNRIINAFRGGSEVTTAFGAIRVLSGTPRLIDNFVDSPNAVYAYRLAYAQGMVFRGNDAANLANPALAVRIDWSAAQGGGFVNLQAATVDPSAQLYAIGLEGAPTWGTWSRGDRILERPRSGIEVAEWYCTVPGSPGTWQKHGFLGAGRATDVGAGASTDDIRNALRAAGLMT